MKLDTEAPSCYSGLLIVPSEHLRKGRECNVLLNKRDPRKIWYQRFEKLEPLWDEVVTENL